MRGLRKLDLFAGCGGSLLAGHLLGQESIAAVEICPKARAVLAKRWQATELHEDVQKLDGGRYRGAVDIVTAGWPCQDISSVGKQRGMAKDSGTRSGLVWDFLRIVEESGAEYAWGENVGNILSAKFRPELDAVFSELGRMGYGGVFLKLPASAVGAPHRRDRFWMLAQKGRIGFNEVKAPAVAPADNPWDMPSARDWKDTSPPPPRADGTPRLDQLPRQVFAETLCPTPRASQTNGTTFYHRRTGELRDDLGTALLREAGFPANKPPGVRMTPEWVENLMGFPIGYTDLDCDRPRVPTLAGEYLFPRGRGPLQHTHEPPRLSAYKLRSPEASARRSRLKQLGNAWVPQQGAAAFRILFAALHRHTPAP